MATLLRADGPRAARVPRPRRQGIILPLRNERPIGCTGGRYRTSKPISATRGTWPAAPRSPPKLRGNSSYQAPTPARSRSTQIGTGADAVRSLVLSPASTYRSVQASTTSSCAPRSLATTVPVHTSLPLAVRTQVLTTSLALSSSASLRGCRGRPGRRSPRRESLPTRALAG